MGRLIVCGSGCHNQGIVVGIDASRCRSGGAIAHVRGVLNSCNPEHHGIKKMHLWAYQGLLDLVLDRPWLIKHASPELEQSLYKQICWQAFTLAKECKAEQCDILFTTDASTFCRFKPMVVLSQDMLSYEPGVMQYFGYGKTRLRLLTILLLQNLAFKHADGVIFLTRYAGNVIQKSGGILSKVAYIPHGVGENFRIVNPIQKRFGNDDQPIECLYVSPVCEFKHQWVVVRGIEILRKRGYNVTLTLIGGGKGRPQKILEQQIKKSDPSSKFILQLDFISHNELPKYLSKADIFVFASSCETFGITLLEAMAVGLPIACSDRSSLPETLQDGGVYFDPENPVSIASAIETIIKDKSLRSTIAKNARRQSEKYTWARCSKETFDFITDTYKSFDNDRA